VVQFKNTPKALANSTRVAPTLGLEYAEGVGKFQPRVASTLGLTEKSNSTLKAFANAVWANAFSVEFLFVSYVRGLSQAPTLG
jgi:hypothetical protein